MLSQRSSQDDRVHPCAFFSHRLSPAERNYDVGNRELLAIRLALGEWCHWLEGAAQPFIVWTDHRNLTYIRSAKRLNARQARWALFFERFDFTISYRPGSKNTKPDALSRQFDSSEDDSVTETILPEGLVMGSLVWGIKRQVKRALARVTVPRECPAGKFFVPRSAGVMRRYSLHTLVLGVLWPPSASGSGGRPWPMTFAISLSLALSAPSPSLVIPLPLGCFALSLFHLVLGHTSL